MSMNMYNSRVSVGSGHAQDRFTDHLYDPLRKTFLEDTTAKKPIMHEAAQFSKVSSKLSPRDVSLNYQIMQNTLIPEYARLRRCDQFTDIAKNKNYCIVNAEKKKLDPITPEQLQRRLKGKRFTEQIIVYAYGEEDQIVQKKSSTLNKYDTSKTNRTERKNQKKSHYNLFSILDEGINNLLAGKSFTFPSNEIIASRPSQNKWNIQEKQ